MTEDFGGDTPSMYTNEETKTAGQPLSDFLLQLEDYTPTVGIYTIIYYYNYSFIYC